MNNFGQIKNDRTTAIARFRSRWSLHPNCPAGNFGQWQTFYEMLGGSLTRGKVSTKEEGMSLVKKKDGIGKRWFVARGSDSLAPLALRKTACLRFALCGLSQMPAALRKHAAR
jgi:hypothetical protein